MAPLERVLLALCLTLALTGAAAAVTIAPRHTPAAGRRTRPTPTTALSATTVSAPTTAPRIPAPGTAALEADLVTPTDMGGYYRVDPAVGESLIESAPCLGPLRATPVQTVRAVTALLGPDGHSLPTFVEEVASYGGGGPGDAFRRAVRAVEGCPSLSFEFGGATAMCRLGGSSIPPVADADRVWSGVFDFGDGPFSVHLGVVQDGTEVLALIWIDSVPPSDPVMGSFVSTVSLAIGKLA